jgi:hypothetical protein
MTVAHIVLYSMTAIMALPLKTTARMRARAGVVFQRSSICRCAKTAVCTSLKVHQQQHHSTNPMVVKVCSYWCLGVLAVSSSAWPCTRHLIEPCACYRTISSLSIPHACICLRPTFTRYRRQRRHCHCCASMLQALRRCVCVLPASPPSGTSYRSTAHTGMMSTT